MEETKDLYTVEIELHGRIVTMIEVLAHDAEAAKNIALETIQVNVYKSHK